MDRSISLDMVCAICGGTGRKTSAPCAMNMPHNCPLCEEYTNLERQIEEAQALVVTLSNRRRSLKIRMNQHHDPLSLFPVEITGKIFQEATSMFEGQFSPFTLGAVCTRWRQIAWSTPQLWNILNIRLNSSRWYHEATTLTRIDLARSWLDRSASLPIALSLEFGDGFAPGDSRLVDLMTHVILHFHRCRYLRLVSIHPLVLLEPEQRTTQRRDEQLEGLELAFSLTGIQAQLLPCPTISLHRSPASMHLSYMNFRNVTIPLDATVSFTGQYVDIETCLRFLSQAHQLKECALLPCFTEEILDSPDQVETITLTKLEKLSVKYDGSAFWPPMICPALISLTCDMIPDTFLVRDPPLYIEITDFIASSGCHLQDLTVSYPPFHEPEELNQLLQFVPELERFSIRYANLGVEFFKYFKDTIVYPGTQPLLPKLKLFQYGDSNIEWPYLPHMFPLIPSPPPDSGPLQYTTVAFRFTLMRHHDGSAASNLSNESVFDLLYGRALGFNVVIDREIAVGEVVTLMRTSPNYAEFPGLAICAEFTDDEDDDVLLNPGTSAQ